MIVFDQLKKNDPQLRAMAMVVLAGLGVLLAGLWWVQIVSVRDYQGYLETQSFRTVRIPAVRGKILDRNGVALAENRPTYNVSLYLEELRKPFDAAYVEAVTNRRAELQRALDEREHVLNRRLTKEERKPFLLSARDKNAIRQQARATVAVRAVQQVAARLQQPLTLNVTNFQRHYDALLALPFPIVSNLDPTNIARFEEQSTSPLGVDLEIQSTRVYPFDTAAAHVLGSLHRDDRSAEGEESYFSFRLPDYRGVVGIEYGFDRELRGTAGAKSVLVNNIGYRQTENVWSPAAPGQNVVLTLDINLQRAVEAALPIYGVGTRGAAVVMDVHTGDLLALASYPTFNPNHFVQKFPPGEWQRIVELQAEKNRATRENYAPGSIFKPVVALAALGTGLNPDAICRVDPDPYRAGRGCIYIGRRKIEDTAPPGDYDFRRALKLSSNSYFVTNGLRAGVEAIVRLGQRFHFGERVGLPTRQEAAGIFPTLEQVHRGWTDGDTANLCIGQGQIAVTPLQMTVMTAALANGGKVLWPRLVERLEPQDPTQGDRPVVFPVGRVREELPVRPEHLRLLREAMLADVEDADGTGRAAAIPGFRICGKTGTAQITDARNHVIDHTTWFVSFAPYENPRYAVVVMIESGRSGAITCAPIAKEIYTAILKNEQSGGHTGETLARRE